MPNPPLKAILEAAIMASETPLNLDRLASLFPEEGGEAVARDALRQALDELATDLEGRGIELREVAGGWRFQTRAECAPWVNRLWEERKPRYSRALLETLAIIAYRQPITRAEIEDIRGVAVSTGIIKTLQDREWVKVVGHRDVPGRPAIFATTREFLGYFNLTSLTDLPTLDELRDLDEINPDLFAEFEAKVEAEGEEAAGESAQAPPSQVAGRDAQTAAQPVIAEQGSATSDPTSAEPGPEVQPADEQGEPS